MQILIPISSRSKFFPADEYFFPIPLIEVDNKPLIGHVIDNFKKYFHDLQFIFVVEKQDALKFSLSRALELMAGNDTKIIIREGKTLGGLCSCLLAIDEIDLDEPVIVANSDIIIHDDLHYLLNSLVNKNASAGVISFNSTHPKWSYVVTALDGTVLQAYEKEVASKNAVAGFYFFEKASLFFDAAYKVIINDAHVNGDFYISSALNEIVLMGKNVELVETARQNIFSLNHPGGIKQYLTAIKSLPKWELGKSLNNEINIVIPSAGLGSRFVKEGWKKPKPFIELNGMTMLANVVKNVSVKNSTVITILQETHCDKFPVQLENLKSDGVKIVMIDGLTAGTACTVLAAREYIDNDYPLLIANSDQLIDHDISQFILAAQNRNLDGAILTFREPSQDPKWSYAKLNEGNLVERVEEKKAISEHATVGIYYFARGKDFIKYAIDMIIENDRTNNEFYTCPVYNYMIQDEKKIGIYEILKDEMHGLGTPSDLKKFISKRNLQKSVDDPDQ